MWQWNGNSGVMGAVCGRCGWTDRRTERKEGWKGGWKYHVTACNGLRHGGCLAPPPVRPESLPCTESLPYHQSQLHQPLLPVRRTPPTTGNWKIWKGSATALAWRNPLGMSAGSNELASVRCRQLSLCLPPRYKISILLLAAECRPSWSRCDGSDVCFGRRTWAGPPMQLTCSLATWLCVYKPVIWCKQISVGCGEYDLGGCLTCSGSLRTIFYHYHYHHIYMRWVNVVFLGLLDRMHFQEKSFCKLS